MAKTNWMPVVVFAAIVLGGIFMGSKMGLFAATPPAGAGAGAVGGGGAVPSTGLTNLYVQYENVLNSTKTHFEEAVINAYDGTRPVGSVTAVRGTSTTTYSSALSVNYGAKVDLYASSTTTLNSARMLGVVMDSANKYVKMDGSNSSMPTLYFRDSSLANYTTSAAITPTIVSQTHTVGSGGSATGYLDVDWPVGSSQYGGPEAGRGVHISVDTKDTSKWPLLDGFTLSKIYAFPGVVSVPCLPSAVSKNSAKVCFDAPALVAGTLYRQQFSLHATNDPGSAASPDVFIDDYQWFYEGGQWHHDIKTSDGTDVGAAQLKATVTIA